MGRPKKHISKPVTDRNPIQKTKVTKPAQKTIVQLAESAPQLIFRELCEKQKLGTLKSQEQITLLELSDRFSEKKATAEAETKSESFDIVESSRGLLFEIFTALREGLRSKSAMARDGAIDKLIALAKIDEIHVDLPMPRLIPANPGEVKITSITDGKKLA